jgi:hypothetical protein
MYNTPTEKKKEREKFMREFTNRICQILLQAARRYYESEGPVLSS